MLFSREPNLKKKLKDRPLCTNTVFLHKTLHANFIQVRLTSVLRESPKYPRKKEELLQGRCDHLAHLKIKC